MQEQQKHAKKESEWYHGGLLFRAGVNFDDDYTSRSQPNENSKILSSWVFFIMFGVLIRV
ncbi:Small heat shock protein 21 [Bienertia sinuspersici]